MASSMGGREPVALNTEALQQVTPCLVKLQETCHKAGRKYNKLRGECKVRLPFVGLTRLAVV